MKNAKYIFMGLCISTILLCMLNSCSLEKRVIITTRGHEVTYPDGYNVPGFELHDFNRAPRDTIINYRIR